MATTTIPRSTLRAILAAFGSVACAAAVLLLVSGITLPGLALAAMVAVPLAIYVALRQPLDFPFGLYVLLVPFDNLLHAGAFGTLTKLLGIVAGAFLLVWVVERRQVAPIGKPVLVLGALAFWMFASTLWAVDQKAALQIMPTYAGLMLLYAMLTLMPISLVQFRTLLFLVVAGGLSAAAYGLHVFHQDPVSQQNSPLTRLVVQVGQDSIDPNHFADALLFPAAIITMWALRSRRVLVKIACLAGLTLLVVAILLSGSREALSALLLIAAYYFWRSRYRLQLVAAVAGVVAVSASVQTSIFLRFATALQTGGSGRTSIWAVALEAAKHRLLQGYGIGNFIETFDMFYLRVHQPYPYGWDSPAHNLVLHYLVELGVIGLALIAGFFWTQFRSLRDIRRGSEFYDYRIVMEAALIAMTTVSMTIDLFTYKYAWLVFAMVALLRNAGAPYQCRAPIRPRSSIITVPSPRLSAHALPRPLSRLLALAPRSES
jgi:O-antigen ligase